MPSLQSSASCSCPPSPPPTAHAPSYASVVRSANGLARPLPPLPLCRGNDAASPQGSRRVGVRSVSLAGRALCRRRRLPSADPVLWGARLVLSLLLIRPPADTPGQVQPRRTIHFAAGTSRRAGGHWHGKRCGIQNQQGSADLSTQRKLSPGVRGPKARDLPICVAFFDGR